MGLLVTRATRAGLPNGCTPALTVSLSRHRYYEARGSGIWLELGKTLDYACVIPASAQHLRGDSLAAYEEACRRRRPK